MHIIHSNLFLPCLFFIPIFVYLSGLEVSLTRNMSQISDFFLSMLILEFALRARKMILCNFTWLPIVIVDSCFACENWIACSHLDAAMLLSFLVLLVFKPFMPLAYKNYIIDASEKSSGVRRNDLQFETKCISLDFKSMI